MLTNIIELEGYIEKDSIQVSTSRFGKKYGKFVLSHIAKDNSWEKYLVYCADVTAQDLIDSGFGKTDKGRKKILVRGEARNTRYTDNDGNTKYMFSIKNASVFASFAAKVWTKQDPGKNGSEESGSSITEEKKSAQPAQLTEEDIANDEAMFA